MAGNTLQTWLSKLKPLSVDIHTDLVRADGGLSPLAGPAVVAYLKSGLGIGVIGRPVRDVFVGDGNEKVIGSTMLQTDGDWVWSSIDVYYIETYGIVVPSEFHEHIRSQCFVFPEENGVIAKLLAM